jgi:hypothetical protein
MRQAMLVVLRAATVVPIDPDVTIRADQVVWSGPSGDDE